MKIVVITQADEALGKFLDYCTYGHMIDNVVLIVTGTLHERDVQVGWVTFPGDDASMLHVLMTRGQKFCSPVACSSEHFHVLHSSVLSYCQAKHLVRMRPWLLCCPYPSWHGLVNIGISVASIVHAAVGPHMSVGYAVRS